MFACTAAFQEPDCTVDPWLADKKVFASLDPVGWYSNTIETVPVGEVLPGDIDVHRDIAAVIENPLYLLLDTSPGAGLRDLPVQLLESEVHMIDDAPTLTFAKSSYTLETEEAERISVDQVSHLLNKEAEKSRRRPLEAKTKTWTQRKGIKHGNVADETGCGQQA